MIYLFQLAFNYYHIRKQSKAVPYLIYINNEKTFEDTKVKGGNYNR